MRVLQDERTASCRLWEFYCSTLPTLSVFAGLTWHHHFHLCPYFSKPHHVHLNQTLQGCWLWLYFLHCLSPMGLSTKVSFLPPCPAALVSRPKDARPLFSWLHGRLLQKNVSAQSPSMLCSCWVLHSAHSSAGEQSALPKCLRDSTESR